MASVRGGLIGVDQAIGTRLVAIGVVAIAAGLYLAVFGWLNDGFRAGVGIAVVGGSMVASASDIRTALWMMEGARKRGVDVTADMLPIHRGVNRSLHDHV